MSEKPVNYFTIDREHGPEEVKEKGSRFISYLFPVADKDTINRIIKKLRKKFHNATHVCFAYRLKGGEWESSYTNDDGEPAGTAGIPIYNEIKNKKYFNVLLVVVRYFGGVKLGTGGLTRAYSFSARKVLDISEKVSKYLKKNYEVSFPFDFTGDMMQIVKKFSIDILKKDYSSDGIYMHISIPAGVINEVKKTISGRSNGKIELSGPD